MEARIHLLFTHNGNNAISGGLAANLVNLRKIKMLTACVTHSLLLPSEKLLRLSFFNSDTSGLCPIVNTTHKLITSSQHRYDARGITTQHALKLLWPCTLQVKVGDRPMVFVETVTRLDLPR